MKKTGFFRMKLLLSSFALLYSVLLTGVGSSAFADSPSFQQKPNQGPQMRGGGGVGNSLGMTNAIYANIGSNDRLEWRGNILVDLNRNEAILKRERLSSVPRVDGVRVYRSKLGSVEGMEFSASAQAPNRWVLCDSRPGARPQGCTLITPLTRTNMKLLSVMGSLRRK